MRVLVTGGGGFIGSHLAESLITEGNDVVVIDQFSTSSRKNLESVLNHSRFKLIESDVNNPGPLIRAVESADVVYHLAPNAETRTSLTELTKQLDSTLQALTSVLSAVEIAGSTVQRIVFASSSVVYGERHRDVCREDSGPLLPISSYGAGKLASEALLSVFGTMTRIPVLITRFGNVVGPRMARGVVRDFVAQLMAHPGELSVLGDGSQTKPFVHVTDVAAALTYLPTVCATGTTVVNIAAGESIPVSDVARRVAEAMNLSPRIEFAETARAWSGDIAEVYLDITRAKSLGWRPSLGASASVDQAARELFRDMTV